MKRVGAAEKAVERPTQRAGTDVPSLPPASGARSSRRRSPVPISMGRFGRRTSCSSATARFRFPLGDRATMSRHSLPTEDTTCSTYSVARWQRTDPSRKRTRGRGIIRERLRPRRSVTGKEGRRVSAKKRDKVCERIARCRKAVRRFRLHRPFIRSRSLALSYTRHRTRNSWDSGARTRAAASGGRDLAPVWSSCARLKTASRSSE